jgi:hypothetical protein
MILTLIIFSISCSLTQANTALPEDHLALPVLITIENGGAASGFYLNTDSHVYFVTASHVLFERDSRKLNGAQASLLSWTKGADDAEKVIIELNLESLLDDGVIKQSENSDVSVIQIAKQVKEGEIIKGIRIEPKYGQILKESEKQIQAARITNTKSFEDVKISNEVYLFGYPTSLGIQESPQFDHQRPLLRRGIIAGKNPSKRTIILDCPSYYGNSGGPVVQVEKLEQFKTEYRVIGIVSQFVPFKETWVNVTHKMTQWEISNSGYTVIMPIDRAWELIKELENN